MKSAIKIVVLATALASGLVESFIHSTLMSRRSDAVAHRQLNANEVPAHCPLGSCRRGAASPDTPRSTCRRRGPSSSSTKLKGKNDTSEPSSVSSRRVDGVGGPGSTVLLVVATLLVVKGLFLPEEVRHLSFCPLEDPVRGRDTLPWRMMEESGRQCGTIPEVMTKYVTAPIVFPGTPEWGTMLNVKEDMMKEGY